MSREYDRLRASRVAVRRQLNEARRAETAARLALRRTRITDPPDMVAATQRQYATAQEAVEVATLALDAIQRDLHALALTSMTH